MATLGLKRQGRLWAVMQGSEMVSSAAGGGVRAQSVADGRGPEDHAEPGMPEPRYDNNLEYENLRAAFDEARAQPPLDAPDKENERRDLERAVATMVDDLAPRRASSSEAWAADDQEQLDEALRLVNDLLKLVGLSVTTYGHLG